MKDISVILTPEEQDLLLAKARLKSVFMLDAILWESVAEKIRRARES